MAIQAIFLAGVLVFIVVDRSGCIYARCDSHDEALALAGLES